MSDTGKKSDFQIAWECDLKIACARALEGSCGLRVGACGPFYVV